MNRRSVLRSLSALLASPLVKSSRAASVSALFPADASACPVRLIALNQLGFRPAHAKRAAVVLEGAAADAQPLVFRVVDAAGKASARRSRDGRSLLGQPGAACMTVRRTRV